MRPISLEIAGLHSFRKRRVIDFAPLLQDNLFGIFGPTGSGKSTILDGITLALFGEVKRADRKTHGIVNVQEEECTVVFTFGIERDGEREQYRVERLFKRSETGGATTKRARLIRIDEEEIPLADKEKEVTALVEEILGIRADDFRLSVVLPQGAFADFLHLKAKDRGAMLQRIFGLEELGEQLGNGLREMRRELDSAREKIAERLNHLQAYDDDALRECHNAVLNATEQLKQTKKNRTVTENEYRKAEELYSLISELKALAADSDQRERKAETLETTQKNIALAERCLTLEPVIAKTADAIARHENARKELEAAQREKTARESAMAPLAERKGWADTQRNPEHGRLQDLANKADVLKQAADREKRIDRLQKDRAERQEILTRTGEEQEKMARRVAETTALEENASRKRKELEDRVEETAKRYDTLSRSETSITVLERLASQREEDTAALEELDKLIRDLTSAQKKGTGQLQKEQKLLEAEEKGLLDLRNQYDRARLGLALAEAVENLEDGKPCPLCGAEHHPHPFHPATDATKSITELIIRTEKGLKERSERIRTLEKQETALYTDLKNARTRQKELAKRIERTNGEIERTVEESGYKGNTDHRTLFDWKEKIGPRLQEAASARTDVANQLREHDRAVKDAADERTGIISKAAGLLSTIESQEKELTRLQNELQDETAAYQGLLAQTDISPEVMSADTAETLLRKVIAEIERLEKEIAEIERNYATAREKLNEAITRYNLHAAALQREERSRELLEAERTQRLKEEGFDSPDEWQRGYIEPHRLRDLRAEASRIEKEIREAEQRIAELTGRIGGRTITEEQRDATRVRFTEAERIHETAISILGAAESALKICEAKNSEWKEAVEESRETLRTFRAAEKLNGYLRGNAFINFLADERLQYICRVASAQLLDLTGGRLEVGTTADEGFYIRDNGNAGLHRPPSTLSGGETFLVSLALSLALSDSLRVGRAPLEFFFLDEGFGTLDSELLETVMDSVERLRLSSRRAIGVISHVRELQERIPRRLVITPATETGGSDIRLEIV